MASTKRTQVKELLAAAAAACEDKKAEDLRILELDPSESGLTDYFLICTGLSDRQNVAITDEVELRLKRDFGVYPNSVEGRKQGEWILMDYVDFIVHVFSAEKRAFYGLERLRKSANVLSVDDLNSQLKAQLKAAIAPGRKKATKTATSSDAVVHVTSKKRPAVATKKGAKRAGKSGEGTSAKASAPKRAPAKKGTEAKKAVATKSKKR